MNKKNHVKTGVFWLIEGELLVIPYSEDAMEGLSKSGGNYNHRLLWESVRPKGCNKPFDYYPRGRVEIDNKGRPVIFMNQNIDDSFIPAIKRRFGIEEDPRIHYDGSMHYKCSLDRK